MSVQPARRQHVIGGAGDGDGGAGGADGGGGGEPTVIVTAIHCPIVQ